MLRIWLLRPLRCGRAWNKRLNCFCRICYRPSRRFSFNHLFAQVRTGFFCFGKWRGTQREIKYRLNLGGEVTSGGREGAGRGVGGVAVPLSVCLSRFPISTPFMHSATPQEDFVCGFGVRRGEEGREAGANRVKRMPHATQACNRAVVMTLIAPHAKSASDQEQRLRGLSSSQEMAERGKTYFLQRFAALTVCRRGG